MTQGETILCAMADLESKHEHSHVGRIVLACWRMDPKRFGLETEGEGSYPDSHKVLAALVYMVRADQVYRPGVNRYALTAKGREMARHARAMVTVKTRKVSAVNLADKIKAMRQTHVNGTTV